MKIATNPTQYWRFKLFEREAKREGLIFCFFFSKKESRRGRLVLVLF